MAVMSALITCWSHLERVCTLLVSGTYSSLGNQTLQPLLASQNTQESGIGRGGTILKEELVFVIF